MFEYKIRLSGDAGDLDLMTLTQAMRAKQYGEGETLGEPYGVIKFLKYEIL